MEEYKDKPKYIWALAFICQNGGCTEAQLKENTGCTSRQFLLLERKGYVTLTHHSPLTVKMHATSAGRSRIRNEGLGWVMGEGRELSLPTYRDHGRHLLTFQGEFRGWNIKVTQDYNASNNCGYIHAVKEDKDGNIRSTYSTHGTPRYGRLEEDCIEEVYWSYLADVCEKMMRETALRKAQEQQGK